MEQYDNLPNSRKEAKAVNSKWYYTGVSCKHGHIAKRRTTTGKCSVCENNYSKESRAEYYQRNRDSMLKIRKEWRERNPDYFKKWRENNRDKVESYKPQKRKRAREIYKHRYNHDVNYRIRRISRSMLRRALNELGVSKNSPTCELLGYDRDMLREHLEDNFLDGMSWDNYGEVWEIDHATPISRMEEFGITSVREINSLGNLIPMYKEDNRDKLEKTLEEYLKDYPSKINLYGKFLK